MIVMIISVIWIMILTNHSRAHYWFTYREVAMTLWAGVTAGIEILSGDKKEDILL